MARETSSDSDWVDVPASKPSDGDWVDVPLNAQSDSHQTVEHRQGKYDNTPWYNLPTGEMPNRLGGAVESATGSPLVGMIASQPTRAALAVPSAAESVIGAGRELIGGNSSASQIIQGLGRGFNNGFYGGAAPTIEAAGEHVINGADYTKTLNDNEALQSKSQADTPGLYGTSSFTGDMARNFGVMRALGAVAPGPGGLPARGPFVAAGAVSGALNGLFAGGSRPFSDPSADNAKRASIDTIIGGVSGGVGAYAGSRFSAGTQAVAEKAADRAEGIRLAQAAKAFSDAESSEMSRIQEASQPMKESYNAARGNIDYGDMRNPQTKALRPTATGVMQHWEQNVANPNLQKVASQGLPPSPPPPNPAPIAASNYSQAMKPMPLRGIVASGIKREADIQRLSPGIVGMASRAAKVSKDVVANPGRQVQFMEMTKNFLPLMGKYAMPLSQAMARGAMDYAIAHHVLHNTDPEYRQKFKEAQDASAGPTQ